MIGRRGLLAGVGAMAATPALAQPPAAPAPEAAPAPAPEGPPPVPEGATRIVLHTKLGDIIADLYGDKAPITVANFLRYVDTKRYDGTSFYRASHAPNDVTFGAIQAGLNQNAAKMLKPIAHEPTTKTGLKHTLGTLSMGRNEPGSATSEYFICVGDIEGYDADPARSGDNQGYAAFGRVVQGIDICRQVLASPVNPNKGPMKGEMLDPVVPITTIRRV